MFNRMKLARKLPLIMIALSVFAVAVTSFVSYQTASASLQSAAEAEAHVVGRSRANEIESWETSISSTIVSTAASPVAADALRSFRFALGEISGDPKDYLQRIWIDENSHPAGERFKMEVASDGSTYSAMHQQYHPFFTKLQQNFNLYDVFLFDAEGNLIYTVFKERDFGQNVVKGELADSGLGRAYSAAMSGDAGQIQFVDFSNYAPSNGDPAAFISTPILDSYGNVLGVLAFQLPIDEMDLIMQKDVGLGETGEAVLIGPDQYLRSDLRLTEGEHVLNTKFEGKAGLKAIAGEQGVMIDNVSFGGPAREFLVFYESISFFGTPMGIIVGREMAEILKPAQALAFKILWQGFLMVAVVGLIGLFFARSIARPLTSVEGAMRQVSDGSYDITVPGTERGDEIGGISNALDEFRVALKKAEKATHDGLFQGAAFEGSSAALMMIDTDFNIIYANRAVIRMFKTHEAVLDEHIGGFKHDDVVGKNIDTFHKQPQRVRQMLSDPSAFPIRTEMKVGPVYFSLDINTVKDLEGEIVGCVLEWRDVTETRKNQAIIDAIDANQVKAEFELDGTVSEVNETFCNMVGLSHGDVIGRMHDTLFKFDPHLAKTNGPLWDRVVAGEAVLGRFRLDNGSGDTSIVDGVFCPVTDFTGKTFRVILLGNNVTASQKALENAQAERRAMQEAQDTVVDSLRDGLKRLAAGNLTTKITTKFSAEYENLRADFNLASDNLASAMQSVVENAGMIRSEAAEIANAADDLSRRTEQQAATLEETATALDQLTSSVRSAAEGANQASEMVAGARSEAEKSGNVVREAVSAMSEIESSSDQISKITSVIDDIAFQTNLLALNAGVEAARAGEAGRGFAVVASEVRALAQRSSDAAREINDLISASGGHVKRGVELVGETGDALEGIVRSVSEIASNVASIAVSSREQSAGLAEINDAVNQLDQVTQQNAAMFEETTAASHALTREAENLTNTVAKFDIGENSLKAGKVVKAQFSKPAAEKPAPAPAQAVAVNEAPAADAIEDGWEDF